MIILEILNQIPFDLETCEIICRELFPYKFRMDSFSSSELHLLSILGQRIINTYLDNAEQIPLHLLESYIKRLADSVEMISKYRGEPIESNAIEAYLQTAIMIMSSQAQNCMMHSRTN